MSNDPNRFWWLSLILIGASCVGLWYFQQMMFPKSDGGVGAVVGFLLGSFLAALLEDYVDQNLK